MAVNHVANHQTNTSVPKRVLTDAYTATQLSLCAPTSELGLVDNGRRGEVP